MPGFQPAHTATIPLKIDIPSQSPALPSTGARGRNGTVHMQNPHSPRAGIGQEAAAAPTATSTAAPLEGRRRIRQGHETLVLAAGSSGSSTWRDVGRVYPNPQGDPYPPCGQATSGGGALLVCLYTLLPPPCEEEGTHAYKRAAC